MYVFMRDLNNNYLYFTIVHSDNTKTTAIMIINFNIMFSISIQNILSTIFYSLNKFMEHQAI